ncbi:hypothetical protein B0H16DRAFT_1452915 [Mycena metata]|uniref:Uncharacterized protein n=1 Tax=Mycena metata TaxID=1033252 RepID=A0AAD7JR83_9AGAR|nr:hypothetical protein B0H16DRAFT_1452915 [Mycena metata]
MYGARPPCLSHNAENFEGSRGLAPCVRVRYHDAVYFIYCIENYPSRPVPSNCVKRACCLFKAVGSSDLAWGTTKLDKFIYAAKMQPHPPVSLQRGNSDAVHVKLELELEYGKRSSLLVVWGVGEEPPALPLGPPFGRERDDEKRGGRALRAAASTHQRIKPAPRAAEGSERVAGREEGSGEARKPNSTTPSAAHDELGEARQRRGDPARPTQREAKADERMKRWRKGVWSMGVTNTRNVWV